MTKKKVTAKKVSTPKVVKEEETTLSLLLKAISARWPNDRIKPGVVLSYLGKEQCYASICRYPQSYTTKEVVFKSSAPSFDEAINQLAQWLVGYEEPIDKLAMRVRRR